MNGSTGKRSRFGSGPPENQAHLKCLHTGKFGVLPAPLSTPTRHGLVQMAHPSRSAFWERPAPSTQAASTSFGQMVLCGLRPPQNWATLPLALGSASDRLNARAGDARAVPGNVRAATPVQTNISRECPQLLANVRNLLGRQRRTSSDHSRWVSARKHGG